jgi:hypothetical protein
MVTDMTGNAWHKPAVKPTWSVVRSALIIEGCSVSLNRLRSSVADLVAIVRGKATDLSFPSGHCVQLAHSFLSIVH